MKKLKPFVLLWLTCHILLAQDSYLASGGEIRFNASTPLEDIDATNKRVQAILQPGTGEFAVALLISDFSFRRKLMQEHFNENYMESDTYPKAYFSGKLLGMDDTTKALAPGNYAVMGMLTIHGVTRQIETSAELAESNGKLVLTSNLVVAPEDFNIEIPRILFQKIAEEVKVAITLELARAQGSG